MLKPVPKRHVCATCQRADVRLYRPYGEFFRETTLFCNLHVPEPDPKKRGWWVPMVPDTDGSVWGYTSVPDDAIARWQALPDAAPEGPLWHHRGWYMAAAGPPSNA